jgi:glutathione S-transferase
MEVALEGATESGVIVQVLDEIEAAYRAAEDERNRAQVTMAAWCLFALTALAVLACIYPATWLSVLVAAPIALVYLQSLKGHRDLTEKTMEQYRAVVSRVVSRRMPCG